MVSKRYLTVRILHMLVAIWLVVTAIFFLFRMMPGSYADIMIFRGADPATARAMEEAWGLNDSLLVQYYRYIANYLALEPGISFQTGRPVMERVGPAMFHSFILIGPAVTLAYLLGSIIGAIAGSTPDSKLDKYGLFPIIVAGTVPSFFTGIVLIYVFSSSLGLFPTSGMFTLGAERNFLSWDFVLHYTLPFTAIVLAYLFYPTIVMRTSIAEVMGQPFIEYQRLSGFPNYRIKKNVSKHASLPVITLYPISMTRAIGGLVLIEAVFNWPGIGYLLVQSIFQRDFPVLQFVFIILAIYIITANFLVDVIYSVIDPRVTFDD